jgi:hypothetical protein
VVGKQLRNPLLVLLLAADPDRVTVEPVMIDELVGVVPNDDLLHDVWPATSAHPTCSSTRRGTHTSKLTDFVKCSAQDVGRQPRSVQ